jgi:glutamyl-tRNA synthetase
MAEKMKFYMVDEVDYNPSAAKKFLGPSMREPFEKLIDAFERLASFDVGSLESTFQHIVDELGIKIGKVAQPVRVALTGETVSPGLFEIIDVLGKDTVLKRLRKALEFMS